jgi:sugar lactone lactonase YvrE
MKFPSQLRSLCLIGTLLLAPGALLHAQYTNGQAASTVLGQPNFTTSTAATTQSGFTTPAGIAVDSTTGKVFVADEGNNRVLRFSSAAALASGSAAEAVFGQPDFTTQTAGSTSSSTLNQPWGVAMDASGNLWVADTGNNRVVAFSQAATVSSPSPTAFLVLGQPGFTTNTSGLNQYTMHGPTSVAVDASGTLYVMDRSNNRVLRFSNAASLANGAVADGLFGQSNYLANTTGDDPFTFGATPWGVAVDSEGNLWVADTINNRVLRFDSADTVSTLGPAASIALGQADLNSQTPATSQTGMRQPVAITIDSVGRLYVSDQGNNRILVFEQPLTLSSGAAASFVLGQSTFGTQSSGTTSTTLNTPQSIAYSDTGYLWVADRGNNRTLSYAITAGAPSLVTHPVKPKIRAGKTKTFSTVLTSTLASDEYTLQASVPKGTTNKASVQFLINGVNVTSALKAGTYQTSELLVNGTLSISVQVKARASATGNLKYTLTATSVTNSSNSATTSSTIQVVVPQS